jgi:hypothetical protein
MSGRDAFVLGVTLFSTLTTCASGQADVESVLLQKFHNQNQVSAARLKNEIAGRLAEASTLRTAKPDQALDLVRRNLLLLQNDSLLPREERAALTRECEARVLDLKELLAAQEREKAPAVPKPMKPGTLPSESSAKSQPSFEDPRRRIGVGQAFAGNAQVTPVVSGNRRFVRIGFAGGFITPSGNAPPIAIQGVVPSVFPGPGPGVFTVGQPIGIFQVFLPQLSLAGMGVSTTVSVPLGSSTVVAGYSSMAEARYEWGTPILGKIPYLGRLFRNVGYGRSSQSTDITISPRVIIVE